MSNILITGGSGLIGERLTEMLTARGHRVSHLGRSRRNNGVRMYTWDIDKHQIDPEALQGTEIIVHLAGAGIADKPWTKERKREILESRTKSTRLLFDVLKKGLHGVKAVISASAIGYYGFDDHEKIFTEETKPGEDFLADVTRRWSRRQTASLH